MSESPLVLVSNRGPVTFGPGGEVRRGTGGLVTALIGLASYRDVTWVASAMTQEDVAEADRNDGRAFGVRTREGDEYLVKLVASDADAYDRFYNIIANPMLWFIQHYLWDLSNAPTSAATRPRRSSSATTSSTRTSRGRCSRRSRASTSPW